MAPAPEPQRGLGAAIREVRHDKGLSQADLGKKAGIHATWISHLESGRNNPAWGTVRRIAAALGTDVASLAERAEELEQEAA